MSHRVIERDTPHNRCLALLVQSALFQVEQHLEFFNLHNAYKFLVQKYILYKHSLLRKTQHNTT